LTAEISLAPGNVRKSMEVLKVILDKAYF